MTSPITLITGGSRGLGAQMALALAREGHDIVFTYREAAAAAEAVAGQIHALGRRALALRLDTARIPFGKILREQWWLRQRYPFRDPSGLKEASSGPSA